MHSFYQPDMGSEFRTQKIQKGPWITSVPNLAKGGGMANEFGKLSQILSWDAANVSQIFSLPTAEPFFSSVFQTFCLYHQNLVSISKFTTQVTEPEKTSVVSEMDRQWTVMSDSTATSYCLSCNLSRD